MTNNMLHLPPIPTSILGLSNITIEDASMDDVGDFIIKVKSLDQMIKCKKCKGITSPHGYNRSIRLRHLPGCIKGTNATDLIFNFIIIFFSIFNWS